MNPERQLTSLGKELEIDTKTVKPFNPAKKHSDLIQKTEKLRETIHQIDEQQKTLDKGLKSMENRADVKEYEELEKIYAYLGDQKKQEDFKSKENLEKLIEDYKALEQDKQNLKSDEQNLEQELETKREIGRNAQNLLKKLKNSEKCISKEQLNIKTLGEVLQTVNEAINYGDGQKGHEQGELGPVKESSHLNQSDHSQNIAQQLEGEFQHLKEIDALLKACECHRVPKTNDFSQLIKDEQTAFQQSIANLNIQVRSESGSGSTGDDSVSENPTSSHGSDGSHHSQVSHYPESLEHSKLRTSDICQLSTDINPEQEKCSILDDKESYIKARKEIESIPENIKKSHESINSKLNSMIEMDLKISAFMRTKFKKDVENIESRIKEFNEHIYSAEGLKEYDLKQNRKSKAEFYAEQISIFNEKIQSLKENFKTYGGLMSGHYSDRRVSEYKKDIEVILKPKQDQRQKVIKNDENYGKTEESYNGAVESTRLKQEIDISKFINEYLKMTTVSTINKSLELMKSAYIDKVENIIKYNNILQELKNYEQKVRNPFNQQLQDAIKGQEQKLDLEVQANDKLIQSSQENLQGINIKIQSLEKKMQECKNKEKKIIQEQSKLEKDYQEMQKAYNKQRKNHINVLEPKVMPILEEMQRVREEMEKREQAKKNIQEELSELEKAKQPASGESSDVGHLASGTNQHASKNKRGKGRYR